jgi:hypothetical protein
MTGTTSGSWLVPTPLGAGLLTGSRETATPAIPTPAATRPSEDLEYLKTL